MKTFVFFALSMTALWFQSLAQSKAYEWQTATAGGYEYKYVSNDPLQARFYTLKNGLTVILSVNKKEPRIFTFIATRAGSNTDPRTNTGLAHYLEHMLFKGTNRFGTLDWEKEKPLLDQIDALYEKYNKTTDTTERKKIYAEIDRVSGQAAKFAIANEYDKMMSSMGAQGTNAFTSHEVTAYMEDLPANAIDRYLAVQAERFRQPVLRIFHTELEAVYEEKNRSLDNDPWKVQEKLYEALFPTHNYGQQTTIGTIEHLKNPSLVEIRNYYNNYYVPNNMAVIFAGDFNPDEVIKKIDAALGYMQPKPVKEYNPAPEAPLTNIQVREVYGPTPENIRLGFRFPSMVNDLKGMAVSTICDELMSNSGAGLIDLNLNKQQKILGGSSTIDYLKDYSVWILSGRPKQGQSLDEVKNLLLGEVEKLKKGDFDESVIRSIVNNYKRNAIQQLESNYSRVSPLLEAFISSGGNNWLNYSSRLDAMSAVTKADIMAFANTYFKDNYAVVYKHKGPDKNIVKVDKPNITPVEVNREAQSPFLQKVNTMQMDEIKPVWLDYQKDFKKSKIGGAEVLYVQNTDNELFRLGYRFPMGTYHSKLLPIATQYLQFLSTDKYNAEQISKEFFNLACNYSISSSGEYTTVRLSGLQENFSKGVKLLEHLIRNCKPNDEALEQLKGRLAKARADAKLNKGAIMQGLMSYAQYGSQNPYNNQLTNEELKNLTSAQLLEVLHSLFDFPHQIIYYGPLSLTVLSQEIKTSHPLAAKFKAIPAKKDFKQLDQTATQVLFADYDMVQAEISWIRNTAQYNPVLAPTVELFNNYFGGGMASIVFQTLRESKALAYSTYGYYGTPQKKGQKYTLTGYIGSQADKLNEAIAGMNELLNQLPESEKSLETAKINMKKTLQTDRILQDGIIYNYLSAQEKGISNDERKLIYDQIDKLTFKDLKQFADTNLANKPYTYCIVASEKRVKESDLTKYGTVKKLSLEEIFGY
jgi:predicted Zn-dependent peptidase